MSTTIFQNGNGMGQGFFNVSPGGVLSVISIGDFSQKDAGASSFVVVESAQDQLSALKPDGRLTRQTSMCCAHAILYA